VLQSKPREKESWVALRQGYLQENKRIRPDRAAKRPKGLAAFFGRIPGVELITKKIKQYRDKSQYDAFVARKRELAERQGREISALSRQQELETLTTQRRLRALELVEQRELRLLENALLKERRIEERKRTTPEPAPEPHADVFNEAVKKPIDLSAEFTRAAKGGEGEGDASGESTQDLAPEAEITHQRRTRANDRSQEVERSAESKHPDRDADSEGPSGDDPTPRRRRNRDRDRGR
jgi:hypothetical protein